MDLINFLKQIRGTLVEIELKNSSIVHGEVVAVDNNMNMNLKNVKVVAKGQNPVEAATYMVRGAQIRYILLPSEMDLEKHMGSAKAAMKKGTK